MGSKELGLDHFLFYDTANQRVAESIRVQTQFEIGPDEHPEGIRLTSTHLFANPVQKNEEKILDPNAHLTWYRVFDPVPDPARIVNYTDQFGRRRVYLGRKAGFLTPTLKVRRGGKFPEKLDHYVAYQVLESTPVDKAVKLRDQWGNTEAKVYYPLFFAAPSRKWHGQTVDGIQNAKAHLAIYRISPSSIEKHANARDQFGRRVVHAFRRVLLAVPCDKGKWEEVD